MSSMSSHELAYIMNNAYARPPYFKHLKGHILDVQILVWKPINLHQGNMYIVIGTEKIVSQIKTLFNHKI